MGVKGGVNHEGIDQRWVVFTARHLHDRLYTAVTAVTGRFHHQEGMGGGIEHGRHDRAVRLRAVEADHLIAVFIGVHPHFVGNICREHHLGAHPADAIGLPFTFRCQCKVHFIPTSFTIVMPVVEL